MSPEHRWTFGWVSTAVVLLAIASSSWLEHRSTQTELNRVRARLEVQARELTSTHGELERLSRLIALELARAPTTDTTVLKTQADKPAVAGMPAAPPAPDAASPPAPSPAALEALKTANSILHEALSAGRWTAATSLRFREQLANLDENDQTALMSELATALNTDKLRVEGPPGPF